jgi:carboxypeptidase family protein/TonB-dependent receptor-like protein
MRLTKACLWAATIVVLAPSLAFAQATLAGIVRDTSGALLPGVTVEATSPALIEKTRSTVTDGNGQYQIVDLRPGTYVLKFTLQGFTTVERTAVQITGSGVTTINADMRIGTVQETIVVTADNPLVDVQTSTRRQQVLDSEVVQALPASRGYGNYLAAVPGIQVTGLGSSAQPSQSFFSSRGGRSGEGTIQIDGMNVGSSVGGGGVSGYRYDMNTAAEVQVSIAGGLAEVDRGGPAFNMIPRTGGNKFNGTYFANWAGDWSQGSNIDARLEALGFKDTAALIKSWDTNGAFGGPILRDHLWFYVNVRSDGTHQDQPKVFANANAGKPDVWSYAPDETIKVRNAQSNFITGGRMTWQATAKNKLGFYIDYTQKCSGSSFAQGAGQCREPGNGWTAAGPGIGPGVTNNSPEAGTIWDDRQKIIQASYSAPLSSRVLLESGYSAFYSSWGDIRSGGALTNFIPVTEQSTLGGVPAANFIYHGWPAAGSVDQQHRVWRGSLSYITGTHNFKVGYQGAHLVSKNTTFVGEQISYRVQSQVVNGVLRLAEPNQLTQRIGPTATSSRVRYDAIYAQDQWTRGRLTLQGGLRYEYATSWSPAGENGVLEANRFSGAFTFPRTEGVRGYHDITPRMGAAYDLFGTGRTAIKVSMSKYLQSAYAGEAYTISNPGVTFVATTTRGWTDADRDYVADCDFMNPGISGECQAWGNLNWGNPLQTTTVNPDVLEGWGVRNWDWQFSAGIQHEIAPRISVDVSYSRRWWGNFFVTHNRALDASDYTEVTLTAPSDPRLPGSGGYPITFLTRNANKALGVTDNYYTTTRDFGDEDHYWHGVDVSFNARLRNGLFVQGGTSTGRGVNDTCDVLVGRFGRPTTPSTATAAAEGVIDGQPACAFTEPWLTTFRGLGTYTVPKIDVLVSAIVRFQPNAQPGGDVATNGASRAANFRLNGAAFLAATGRSLRPGVTQETVNLLRQGDLYGDRVNTVDLRLAKLLRFHGTRANVGVDFYNLFNSNTATTYEAVYDPANPNAWFQPTAVVQPRFMRFNVQFDF